jgi:hypothetical protein
MAKESDAKIEIYIKAQLMLWSLRGLSPSLVQDEVCSNFETAIDQET